MVINLLLAVASQYTRIIINVKYLRIYPATYVNQLIFLSVFLPVC